MNEKPIEWCFLWMAPCLPSSEWASWAQAIFSAAAVFSAIGVVWWQQHVAARQTLAAAQLAASGILTLMDQTIGGTQSVVQAFNERITGNQGPAYTPAHIASVMATLPFPSREDLLALNGAHPACAINLLRASNSMAQVRTALGFLAALPVQRANEESTTELLRPLHALVTEVEQTLIQAKKELDHFCP
ncbi:MAG: hypothetical protein WA174_01560 [Rhodoferax sp.]